MSEQNDFIRALLIHLYRNQWVLTSSQQIRGGQILDTAPVRILEFSDRARLVSLIEELLAENIPTVPQPDWNNPRMAVGIRAEALGLKSWLSFARNARCFYLEVQKDKLRLEEWPKEGGSFTANASWRKEFPGKAIEQVVDFLLRKTKPVPETGRASSAKRRSAK